MSEWLNYVKDYATKHNISNSISPKLLKKLLNFYLLYIYNEFWSCHRFIQQVQP